MPRRLEQPFDLVRVAALFDVQSGVVARRQLLAEGATSADVRRLIARGELYAWAPGVYLRHGGEPSWLERAWGAVLLCWPAALVGDSALRAEAGPGWRGRSDDQPILVGIDLARRLRIDHPGVIVRRVAGLDERCRWQLSPPRMRFEDATVDAVIAAAGLHDRVEVVARAVRSRRTTPDRLIAAIGERARLPDREWLVSVLHDVRDGTSSILEHGYLTQVERAHGLPTASRQAREATTQGVVLRDNAYEEFDVLVELDGRLDHLDGASRTRDLERDLDAAVNGRLTVRLGWSQVFHTPCVTAESVGRLLNSRGWGGTVRSCGPTCALLRAS